MSSGGRRPPDIEGMVSLKVDNLTYRTSEDDLRKVFDRFGHVGDVYIPRDRYTNKGSRGFAFIRYYDERDAQAAIHKMDGKDLDGRQIRVQIAKYGRPDGRRSSGGGDRGGSRYGYRSGGGGGGGSRDYGGSRYNRRSRSQSYSRSRSPYSRSRSRSPGRNYGGGGGRRGSPY